MIDIHTHILPALDDGAASIAMARAAVADGITTVVATPHVRDDYPTTADEMQRAGGALGATATSSSLPFTGLGLLGVVLLAAIALGTGVALRRASRT